MCPIIVATTYHLNDSHKTKEEPRCFDGVKENNPSRICSEDRFGKNSIKSYFL